MLAFQRRETVMSMSFSYGSGFGGNAKIDGVLADMSLNGAAVIDVDK